MKTLPLYSNLEEAARDGLYNITTIAILMNESRQCVHSWHKRRANTGFPEADAEYRRDISRTAPLFSFESVQSWRRNYKPNLGGRVAR